MTIKQSAQKTLSIIAMAEALSDEALHAEIDDADRDLALRNRQAGECRNRLECLREVRIERLRAKRTY